MYVNIKYAKLFFYYNIFLEIFSEYHIIRSGVQ